ncbi:uncharacterized protein FA14DRAFT_153677 [Meira miltonrushii]|uniref:Uncharacterized protein n=1 Tax=Meira miltonrushii TaxID=1280837 RepID=A0A316VPK6_9BASI|nr:uncharacterized protein FA14DRAFT_153677 [Meira miltonrushii]PWN38353.1 hypothetical protein FA14DRAFT_153677 [Meira miltonrushii]
MSDQRDPSNISQRQLDILRRLAAREAARRQELGEKSQSSSPQPGGRGRSGSETGEDGVEQITTASNAKDASMIDVDRLQEILQQEKAKNDFAWAKVRERTHRLTEQQSQDGRENEGALETDKNEGKEERMRKKRIELEYLDYEIEQAQKDLTILEPPHSDAILALLTRATLASAVEQYQASIASLERELDEEKSRRKEDDEMLHDIGEVRIGLEKRKAVLKERLNSVDFASIEGSLIDITGKILIDEEGVQQAQLRLLIDGLINKAWDTPVDPYVDISDGFLPAISAFLLRANIAIEHPRDSNRIRLIDFHRSALG